MKAEAFDKKFQEIWEKMTPDQRKEAGFSETAEALGRGTVIIPDGKHKGADFSWQLHHEIVRWFWQTEYKYTISIWQGQAGGPYLPVDKLELFIVRERDEANYRVYTENSAVCHEAVTLPGGGPTGRSSVYAEITYGGWIYKTPLAWQEASRNPAALRRASAKRAARA